ncbi:pali-domain-containing protein [Auriscalpium vulgare]|uniref:Pali-domain-containing protein n=1 Tax=Auriscalpium vulgare TaxID=40419 RepID=A0ACB8SB51_9AGAM|nr:pali-domain-containing protein [Auriscalpium vulgare]
MGLIRPATPGFIVTLIATGLLAVVSFSVPWFKSVFFLRASLAVEGISGSITFGTLGYCLELSNGTTCSKPSVGYQLNINQLVGDNTKLQIPNVVVKWLTYALVLHIVAFAFAAVSAVFGLLAHVREFSMTCFSTCISGFGAAIALLAFIFDLAFFFVAKSRINAVKGGSATMGNAIWLTLAAWLLLFFSGCFYGLGRCCVRRRPRDNQRNGSEWNPPVSTGPTYEDQMRLDAVKAEADRKARAKQGEVGLPAFQEYDPTQPLTAGDEETGPTLPYRDNGPYGRQPVQQGYAGGYARAQPGTRAVDEYYAPAVAAQTNNAYPPQPRRQPTNSSGHTQQTSGYAPSNYAGAHAITTSEAVPAGAYGAGGQYGPGHQQYPTQASQYRQHDEYAAGYGQVAPVNNSYNIPAPSHAQYPTADAYQDPFQSQYAPPPAAPLNTETYNATALLPGAARTVSPPRAYTHSPPQTFYTQDTGAGVGVTRSYTLGGGGYGDNIVPDLHEPEPSPAASSFLPYPGSEPPTPQPSGGLQHSTSRVSPTSPRGPRPISSPIYDDSPPLYDEGLSHTAPPLAGKR